MIRPLLHKIRKQVVALFERGGGIRVIGGREGRRVRIPRDNRILILVYFFCLFIIINFLKTPLQSVKSMSLRGGGFFFWFAMTLAGWLPGRTFFLERDPGEHCLWLYHIEAEK